MSINKQKKDTAFKLICENKDIDNFPMGKGLFHASAVIIGI